MFDLETAIAEWRGQMQVAGIKTPALLEELECHLREEIERQRDSGLDEPQALAVAIQTIGNGNSLNDEFRKIQLTKGERDWRLKQMLFAGGLSAIVLLLALMLLFRFGALKDNFTRAQQMSGLAALGVMMALVVGGRAGYRLFPVVSSKRIRDAIGTSAGVLVMAVMIYCFNFVLPRHDYTMGQLVVFIVWSLTQPLGILGGLILGIETAARKDPWRMAE